MTRRRLGRLGRFRHLSPAEAAALAARADLHRRAGRTVVALPALLRRHTLGAI